MRAIQLLYTIYNHPPDYPDHFVVRRWAICTGDRVIPEHLPWAVVGTLEEARESIPAGTYCFNRNLSDDPTICESWF